MAKDIPDIPELASRVLKWCSVVEQLATSRSEAQFLSDIVSQLAAAKAIENVGENCGRILRYYPEWAAAHPELELAHAYRFRNRISHGYDGLDFKIVWQAAVSDIPKLAADLKQAMSLKP
jgi:uncharacterized protein with HEPN domain